MSLHVRRGDDRPRTAGEGVQTRHAFSAGHHYDPSNTSFGPLLLHDEHVLDPGADFPPHRHRDVEVVTWVVEGVLTHDDSAGHVAHVHPGQVQRMSAGSGVVHTERNDGDAPVRMLQAWLVPDRTGRPPSYALHDAGTALAGGGLVPVVSGSDGCLPALGTSGATLYVARLLPARWVLLPDAPALHVHVARGDVVLEPAGELADGDAVRITGGGGQRLTATTGAEVLVWELHGA